MEIPRDLFTGIAKWLDYEDILNLCSVTERFGKICKDSVFWKTLIRSKYLDETPEAGKTPMEQFILLEAKSLLGISKNLLYKGYQIDARYDKLKLKNEELEQQINEIQKKVDLNLRKMRKIEKEYRDKANNLTERAVKLENLVLPTPSEYKYYDIRAIGEDLDNLLDLLADGDIPKVLEILKEYGVNEVKPGDIIGISDAVESRTKPPIYLLYTYRNKDGNLVTKRTFMDIQSWNASQGPRNRTRLLGPWIRNLMKRKDWDLKEFGKMYGLRWI